MPEGNELMKADNLLSEVLHSMGEALLVTDEGGIVQLFNEGAERLFGYEAEEVLGRPIEMLIPETSRQAHVRYMSAFASSGERRRLMGGRPDVQGLRRDGSTFDAEASISRLTHNDRTFLIAVIQDLSPLKRLGEIERSLQNAQRIASLGNWDWNVATGELWWSDEIFRIFGVEPNEFAPSYQRFVEFIHPQDRRLVQEAVDAAVERGADYDVQHRVIRPDGAVRTVREQGEVIFEQGKPVRMVGLVHDVTDRILMESRLRQAQKLETLGRLTGGIAHDFNNLLTVIMGNLEIARVDLGDDHSVTELLDEALQAVELGSSLTESLLMFSRRHELNPEAVDLGHMVAGMQRMLQRTLGEHIQVEVTTDMRLWQCLVDPGQLQNVILNMAVNGRDAMPQGGTLSLRVSNTTLTVEDAKNRLNAAPGDYLKLSIADTGEGMSAHVQEHAFEPFFTTKEHGKGTGLGLSTVYGFVTQSGGFIEIDSTPGQGTTFHVHLPRLAVQDGRSPGPLRTVPGRVARA